LYEIPLMLLATITPPSGFDGNSCEIINALREQSPDIAQGVDRTNKEKQGAGDQDMMFGYASNETDVLMPAPITYAHRLVQKQAEYINVDVNGPYKLNYYHY